MAAGLLLTLEENAVLTDLDELDVKHPVILGQAFQERIRPLHFKQSSGEKSRQMFFLISYSTSFRFILVPLARSFSPCVRALFCLGFPFASRFVSVTDTPLGLSYLSSFDMLVI